MPFPNKDTQFKPGQTGNPNGRPKLPDLKEVMAEILGEEKDGKTAIQAIVAKLRQLAANGNIKAAEVLLSRGYGLPKQQIEYSGEMNFNTDPFKQVRNNTEALTPPQPPSPENNV